MTPRTFNELFEPQLTLTLEKELGRNYIVLDATDGDTVYMRSPDLWLCVRFMRALAVKKDAVVDERTIERLIDGTIGHSVKVPQGSLTLGGVVRLPDETLSRRTEGASTPEAGVRDSSGERGATDGESAAASPDSTRLRLVL